MGCLIRIGALLQFAVIGSIAWIIRRNCFQYADFSYIRENEVLQGSVVATFTGKLQVECETECIENYRCKSINSENAGQRTCELNSENIMDIIANLTLTSKAGWTYKATNYSELLVGGNCKLLRPCPMNQVCVDSCDCPGYICHKCRGIKIGIDCLSKIVVEGKALGIENKKIPDYQMEVSSFNQNDQRGHNARLNSDSGWCAKIGQVNTNQFIQVSFTRRKIITDIAVQGFKNNDWVTSYLFLYTEDNIIWQTYKEDGVNKTFKGTNSINAIVKENLFYYIRAYSVKLNPRTWVKWICMRIELYGIDDPWQPLVPEVFVGYPLGLESRAVKDYQMTASWKANGARAGRLNNNGQWCNSKTSQNEYIRVDFLSRKIITDIAIQAHYTEEFWVERYLLKYTEDSYQWKTYQENGIDKVFDGPAVKFGEKKNKVQHPIRAFAIKVNPKSWQGLMCLRMELYGIEDPAQPPVPTGCSSNARPLGIASEEILNYRFSSSGYYNPAYAPSFGRLAGNQEWCESYTATAGTFIQVDIGKKMVVVAVATQGRISYEHENFVKSYYVSYGDNSAASTLIMAGSVKKLFPGNIDKNGIVKNKFEPPITARYVRIHPKDFEVLICLRMELYGCDLVS